MHVILVINPIRHCQIGEYFCKLILYMFSAIFINICTFIELSISANKILQLPLYFLILFQGKLCALSKEELSEAILKCKILIVNSDVCSDERKWLVRRLIELRYQLLTTEEVKKEMIDENESVKSRIVLGHHFNLRYEPTTTTKRYCDTCCSIVWNLIQAWYQCAGEFYTIHLIVIYLIKPSYTKTK